VDASFVVPERKSSSCWIMFDTVVFSQWFHDVLFRHRPGERSGIACTLTLTRKCRRSFKFYRSRLYKPLEFWTVQGVLFWCRCQIERCRHTTYNRSNAYPLYPAFTRSFQIVAPHYLHPQGKLSPSSFAIPILLTQYMHLQQASIVAYCPRRVTYSHLSIPGSCFRRIWSW
jgi:hypothetical protein